MSRDLSTITTFLVLGAAVNVAVAWACAFSRTECPQYGAEMDAAFRSAWDTRLDNGWPDAPARVTWRISVSHTVVSGHAYDLQSQEPRLYWLDEHRLGWPFRSLSYCSESRVGDSYAFVPPGLNPVRMPLRPIWRGFLLNTALSASALWLAAFGPRLGLRFVRRLRGGLCTRCGYPHGTSQVCTECGATIRCRGYPRAKSPALTESGSSLPNQAVA